MPHPKSPIFPLAVAAGFLLPSAVPDGSAAAPLPLCRPPGRRPLLSIILCSLRFSFPALCNAQGTLSIHPAKKQKSSAANGVGDPGGALPFPPSEESHRHRCRCRGESAETHFTPEPGPAGRDPAGGSGGMGPSSAPFGGAQPPAAKPHRQGWEPHGILGEAAPPVGLQPPGVFLLLARAGGHVPPTRRRAAGLAPCRSPPSAAIPCSQQEPPAQPLLPLRLLWETPGPRWAPGEEPQSARTARASVPAGKGWNFLLRPRPESCLRGSCDGALITEAPRGGDGGKLLWQIWGPILQRWTLCAAGTGGSLPRLLYQAAFCPPSVIALLLLSHPLLPTSAAAWLKGRQKFHKIFRPLPRWAGGVSCCWKAEEINLLMSP